MHTEPIMELKKHQSLWGRRPQVLFIKKLGDSDMKPELEPTRLDQTLCTPHPS